MFYVVLFSWISCLLILVLLDACTLCRLTVIFLCYLKEAEPGTFPAKVTPEASYPGFPPESKMVPPQEVKRPESMVTPPSKRVPESKVVPEPKAVQLIPEPHKAVPSSKKEQEVPQPKGKLEMLASLRFSHQGTAALCLFLLFCVFVKCYFCAQILWDFLA